MPSKSLDTKSNHPHYQVRSCGSRRFLAAASYDSNVWPYNLGNVGGGVVLDFESLAVRLPSAEEESRDFVAGAGRRKRDCNVEPVASGDRVYPNFVWTYNCSDPFEASIRTQTHCHLEPSYVDKSSSFELGHNGVRVVLDFESSAVLLPSTNRRMQPMSLCNDTRSCDIMLCVRLHVQLPVMIHLKKQKLLAGILRIIVTISVIIFYWRKSCFGIWHIYATDVVSLLNHPKLTEEPAGADLKFEQGNNITFDATQLCSIHEHSYHKQSQAPFEPS
uniref:Uncharacterized protein n=1 Tax=Tanacetum cinerariifolium TaxID=118510 RepID=A0A699IRT9_TANCI|nr:hypothetical protein [Tanacetum cinerariifolium]